MQNMILRYPSPAMTNTVKRDSVKRESVRREPSVLNNSNLTNTINSNMSLVNMSANTVIGGNMAFGPGNHPQKLKEFGSNFQDHNSVTSHIELKQPAIDFGGLEKNAPNITMNSEKLKVEILNLKQRLDYFENFIKNIVKFDNTSNMIDLQSYIQTNYKRFTELTDEMFINKENYEVEKTRSVYFFSKASKGCNQLEKSINEIQNKIREVQEGIKNPQPLPNNPIVVLEKKIDTCTKEIEILTKKNEQAQEELTKKDFFREYDFMCKEVEGLKKQNQNLQETIKKLQSQSQTPAGK